MSNTSMPPKFVPTLTDVVRATEYSAPVHTAPPSTDQFEDQIIHRVMQRVDLVLERRLREAVGQVILAHTQALGPRLREEIEWVVRESVVQAVAQELPIRPPN
jgi:hypothetical protein